jgi:hypothetical protein
VSGKIDPRAVTCTCESIIDPLKCPVYRPRRPVERPSPRFSQKAGGRSESNERIFSIGPKLETDVVDVIASGRSFPSDLSTNIGLRPVLCEIFELRPVDVRLRTVRKHQATAYAPRCRRSAVPCAIESPAANELNTLDLKTAKETKKPMIRARDNRIRATIRDVAIKLDNLPVGRVPMSQDGLCEKVVTFWEITCLPVAMAASIATVSSVTPSPTAPLSRG